MQVGKLVDVLLEDLLADSPAMTDFYGQDLTEFNVDLRAALTLLLDRVCPAHPVTTLRHVTQENACSQFATNMCRLTKTFLVLTPILRDSGVDASQSVVYPVVTHQARLQSGRNGLLSSEFLSERT
jgi:hypothetical protein